jgi:dipeptidase D
MTLIATLEPQIVWQHFDALCRIPRPSKHETLIRDHLIQFAVTHQLSHQVDAVGNLIIKKPASVGMENTQTVILQAHLDMVTQANSDIVHDFFKDPIKPIEQDGWLIAEHTTLGADNGIGVALALAALESNDLVHGPLEVLLTIDEESGMTGAIGLDETALSGSLMINLDTESWGEFYIGCAGGTDVNIEQSFELTPLATNDQDPQVTLKLHLKGLRGGHSGVNIHEGRANANPVLIGLIHQVAQTHPTALLSFHGGTARNAIAREAVAHIVVPQSHMEAISQSLKLAVYDIKNDYAKTDALLNLQITKVDTPATLNPLSHAQTKHLLHTLIHTPYGVKSMSASLDNIVETSNNLGVVHLAEGHFTANCMVRSLKNSEVTVLAQSIQNLYEMAGATVTIEGTYPCWTPNPDSPLLRLCQATYADLFKKSSGIQIIHAGLECGLISGKYPHLDIISFGPNIEGAHAPGEKVAIKTVGLCWDFLQHLLGVLPKNPT